MEKAYNKPANSPGGVIGLTQKKESVAKWNLIKHEKMKYAKFIDDVCEFNAQDEYSTHQEFSSSTTASEESNIQTICQFLSQLGDIFDEGDFQNIVTGEILDNATKQFLLGCLESGDKLFYDYRNNRILLKNKMLFDRISKEVIKKVVSQNQPAKDIKK